MKKEQQVMQLVDIYGKRFSVCGNPSFSVSFRKSNGEYLTGRTAPNASVGYWLCNSHLGEILEVTYHFTKGGKCIIDTISD